MHEKHGAEHVHGEAERDESREQSEYEGNAAHELEIRDERRNERGHGDSCLREESLNVADAHAEDLLPAVSGKDDAGDETQDEEADVFLTVGCGEERGRHGRSVMKV